MSRVRKGRKENRKCTNRRSRVGRQPYFTHNHKNYNFLARDRFKKVIFSSNSLSTLLSDSLLLDSLLLDSLLSDSSVSQ